MRRLLLLIALGSSAALPLQAQELTPGHIVEAQILGLDPHLFTRTELAQIDGEPTERNRQERIRYILEMKERRGEIPRGRFIVGAGTQVIDLGPGR